MKEGLLFEELTTVRHSQFLPILCLAVIANTCVEISGGIIFTY